MAKRKREGEASSNPTKKVVIDAPSSSIKITSIIKPANPPVIATTPGIELPSNTSFEPYSLTSSETPSKRSRKDELILKSSSHPRLDYTAREEGQSSTEPHLKHYLGLYDPKTGELELIEAKKMVVRATVRDSDATEEDQAMSDIKPTMMDLKTNLGQTFGTKKAKKVIQDTVMNAISSPKKPGDSSIPAKINNAAKAMLQSVGDITSTMASREELQAVVDEAKPVPKVNLEAEEIEDAYDPKEIIGGDILNLIPVREWQEKAKHNEGIQVSSRFVAARVSSIALNHEATTRLRVLRYLYFLILFYLHSKPGRERGSRQIPPRDKLRTVLAPAPEAVIENIRRKFSEQGQMRKFHVHLLMTHCCVFASIVDNFEVDTQNLKDDLKLDQKMLNSYFHEIGGRVKPVTNKQENRTVHLARLALPLDFPKQRHLAPKRR